MFLFLQSRIPAKYALYLILIPSLILYSSVSLRDTLVLVAGVFSVFYLIERNFWGSLFFIVLVGLTKLQNFPPLMVLWLFTFIYQASKSYLRLGLIASFLLFCLVVFFDTFSGIINLYRVAWAMEDGMSLDEATGLEFTSGIDLIYLGLFDICQSVGLPGQIDHPKVLIEIERCCDLIQSSGISAGCMSASVQNIKTLKNFNYKFIAYLNDAASIKCHFDNVCKQIKE